LSEFNQTLIFLTDFFLNPHIELHENPSTGSQIVDKANSCFSQFCEHT